MDDKSSSSESSEGSAWSLVAYMVIAFVSALGCASVAVVVLVHARPFSSKQDMMLWPANVGGIQELSTGAIWALSCTVFAPAVIGIGVSYCVYKKSSSPESSNRSACSFVAFMVIAFVSALGCASVAFVVFVLAPPSSRDSMWFLNIAGGIEEPSLSTSAIWALSCTVFAPAVMGIGVSYWVYKTNSARRTAESSRPRELDPKIQFGIKE